MTVTEVWIGGRMVVVTRAAILRVHTAEAIWNGLGWGQYTTPTVVDRRPFLAIVTVTDNIYNGRFKLSR